MVQMAYDGRCVSDGCQMVYDGRSVSDGCQMVSDDVGWSKCVRWCQLM
jgi:hypothetical protein